MPALLHNLTPLLIAHQRELALDLRRRLPLVDPVRADALDLDPSFEVTVSLDTHFLVPEALGKLLDLAMLRLVLCVELAVLDLERLSLLGTERVPRSVL